MRNQLAAHRSFADFFRFVFPILLLYTVFFLVPICQTVLYSFTDWNGIDVIKTPVGLSNYVKALKDSLFWNSLRFTGEAMVLYTIAANLIGFVLAYLINHRVHGKTALKALLFMPFIFNNVTIGFLWQFLLGRYMTDLYAATGFPLFAISWLSDASIVTYSVVFVKVWQSLGYYMMLYLAGMQMVSGEPLEAAYIDGCSRMKAVTHIIVPLMKPTIITCMFLSITDVLHMFPLLMTLTSGGPGHASESISLYIYNEAFKSQRMGYASAMSVMLAMIVLVLTALQLKLTKGED